MSQWREEIIGDCRIILGDALNVLADLDADSASAVITDPPYCNFDIACRRIEAAYKQPDLFVKQPSEKPTQLDLLTA